MKFAPRQWKTYEHRLKCGCGCHWKVYSWYADWPPRITESITGFPSNNDGRTIYCPECGRSDLTLRLGMRTLNGPVCDFV